jgi:hypothetical protein
MTFYIVSIDAMQGSLADTLRRSLSYAALLAPCKYPMSHPALNRDGSSA